MGLVENERKAGAPGRLNVFSFIKFQGTLCLFPVGPALQQEHDYGYYNEDHYESFCDFHRETGYALHAQDKKPRLAGGILPRDRSNQPLVHFIITSFSILNQPYAPRF